MKNSKMFFVLAASMVTAVVNADNKPNVLPIGEHVTMELFTNDTSDNGNFLHQIVRQHNNKDLELNILVCVRAGAMKKELDDAIKKEPYNCYPESIAAEMYRRDKQAEIEEKTVNAMIDNLQALLSGKDNDGRVPADLARALGESTGNPEFVKLAVGLDNLGLILELRGLEPAFQEEINRKMRE
ncbi:MAG TPA: hypothetical protein VKR54_02410 [Candidatus Babeliales bacterium]|nr:hypothetical protein [Candidatus Babeliales bacterium]